MEPLKEWLAHATDEQRMALARHACTSIAYLTQLASGHRRASAETAGRVEAAARLVVQEDDTAAGLPMILRLDLCAACAACPYALECVQRKSH